MDDERRKWQNIRTEFEATVKPIRQIAREYHVCESVIRKRAKQGEWTRADARDELAPSSTPVRDAMMRELNNPSLPLALKLKLALAMLPYEDRALFGARGVAAAPALGKKAQALEAAKAANVGRFATPPPPKLVMLKDHKRDE
jgi:hypothetical protein